MDYDILIFIGAVIGLVAGIAILNSINDLICAKAEYYVARANEIKSRKNE